MVQLLGIRLKFLEFYSIIIQDRSIQYATLRQLSFFSVTSTGSTGGKLNTVIGHGNMISRLWT